ncbi:MAG: hypothetical protein Q4A32_01710 [Lachnospiraceae bacterium]|nr:hypothetical protein [Lachnospiraceae bacterium]
MSLAMGIEWKKDKKRAQDSVKGMRKQGVRASFATKKGRVDRKEAFPALHAGVFDRDGYEYGRRRELFARSGLRTDMHEALFEKENRKYNLTEEVPERVLCQQLADAASAMERYLQPEKRNSRNLKTVYEKIAGLEQYMTELSEMPGGLSPELRALQKSVRQKKRKLEQIMARNVPENPESLRSFDEVGAGIGRKDDADLQISGLLETVNRFLSGRQSFVEGMETDDLVNMTNEIDAMRSRHRYTKEQMALDQMEQESLGAIVNHPNRVMQEASEIKKEPQVRRETGSHEENMALFENRKGKEERDALRKKHQILSGITLTNRNNLRQKQNRDGLEAVRGMMHNGERAMGFAPLAAMGLGGNLYKGFAGMNYMMSMTPAAVEKNKKGADIQGITERYLGLDQLYRNFMTKNSDIRNRTAFLKRYGMEGNVRMMIRKERDMAFGKGSENRMNSFLMKKYATELWKGAYLKEDGSVITERERQAEPPEKKQRRKLYADMLRAMGFQIRYPNAEGEIPGTSAVDIFKRLVF